MSRARAVMPHRPAGPRPTSDATAVSQCDTDAVHDGGDHWIVVEAVRAVATNDAGDAESLVFYRSTYRQLNQERIA